MRIEGMDAAVRVPDFTTERVPVQQATQQATPQAQSLLLDASRKAPTEQKSPSDTEAAIESNNRLVRMAIDKANKAMLSRDTSLQFEPYDKTGDMIVRIIDTNTKEVLREIPSKKILDMVANMLEMAGILVDERR